MEIDLLFVDLHKEFDSRRWVSEPDPFPAPVYDSRLIIRYPIYLGASLITPADDPAAAGEGEGPGDDGYLGGK